MDLRHGDCLEVMNELENDSVDLLFADLPYHQTSCKWDVLIDLELFWEQVNRILTLKILDMISYGLNLLLVGS